MFDTFPQEILDMIYYELLKTCADVDDIGKFNVGIRPFVSLKVESTLECYLVPRKFCDMVFDKDGRDAVFPLLPESLRDEYAAHYGSHFLPHRLRTEYVFLQPGYLLWPMPLEIIETLLRHSVLWMIEIDCLSPTSLALKPLDGNFPYESVRVPTPS
jgi:hypothetical protein